MLQINGLSKAYAKSEVYAVKDLTLSLNPGEIFGFLGPNGAGKTTTIKLVTGILPYEIGSINICGYDLKSESRKAKLNVGYVPDNHSVYDKLTGREYVNFLADVYCIDKFERERRVEELLEKFHMKDAFNAQIKTYSHGMKQKICIIGALIHEPKIWILDEPLTGLDPQSAYELKQHMRDHCDKGNVVLFSTHILEVAEKICDRIGIINKGKLLMTGNLSDLRTAQNDSSLEEIFLAVTGGADAAVSGGSAE